MITDNSQLTLDNLLSISRGDMARQGETEKRGSCDTPFYPVDTNVSGCKPFVRVDDDRIFVDWLKFFGKNTKLNSYHEYLLVELFVKGNFFRTPEYPDRDELDYTCFDCGSPIHEGSSLRWSKHYQNSIGVVLKIAYFCDSKVESGKLIDLVDTNRIVAVCLEFTGTPLSQLIPRNNQVIVCQIIDLVYGFSEKIKVTRFDTTLEFSKEKLNLFEVREAIDNKDVMGCENYHSISGSVRGNISRTITCYFGGEKSDRRTRLYETECKHGYIAVRFEVQNRRKYAGFVVSHLMHIYKSAVDLLHPCNDLTEVNKKINQFIIDYNLSRKNFVLTKKEDKKRWQNRWQVKELPFWEEFKKSFNVNELKYQFCKEDLPVTKSINHFVKMSSGLLCSLWDNLGEKGVLSLIKAIIVAKKKGIGLGMYNSNSPKNIQLSELSNEGILGICDDYMRKILHGVGFFSMPSVLPIKNKKTILKDDNLRLKPRIGFELDF